jgi:AAA domain
MSLLDQVSHSKEKEGIRVVISGVEKVGKTTLGCGAPRALLIPLEQGYSGVNVMKTPMPESWHEIVQLMDEITKTAQRGAFEYESLVFDSATALERLIHESVLSRDPHYSPGNTKTVTMDSALGGYGKGYSYANDLFAEFLKSCDILATHGGINIIMTTHVFAGKTLDPTAGEYDTWDILLHSPKNQKTYGKREMLTQWADMVGFLHEPIFVTEGKTISKGIDKGKGRMLGVNRTPGYVAGNRFGIITDISIPKEGGWNYLADEIYKHAEIDVFNRDI